MYTKIDETKAQIEAGNCLFYLDSNEQDFTLMGIEPDEEMLKEEKDRAAIHAQMLEDFKDETKLNVFIALLQSNPSTAYTNYINQIK
jgi:hypothetical protein